MTRFGNFARYWLPMLLWMVVIYSASGDTASFQRSSRIIGPVVHWLFPDLSDEGVDRVVFVVRKTAHVVEYAVLALLLWRALRKPRRGDERRWEWKPALIAFALAVGYAITDELHQTLVPNRFGAVGDVVLDSTGAALALLLLRVTGHRLKLWKRE